MTDPISADNLSNSLAPGKAELTLPAPRWLRGFDRPRRIAQAGSLRPAINSRHVRIVTLRHRWLQNSARSRALGETVVR